MMKMEMEADSFTHTEDQGSLLHSPVVPSVERVPEHHNMVVYILFQMAFPGIWHCS